MYKRPAFLTLALLTLVLLGCASASPRLQEAPSIGESIPGMAPQTLGGVSDFARNAPAQPAFESAPGDQAAVERLVIRTASLSIVVHDPAGSAKEISRLADELGGFVVSSNVYESTFSDIGVTAVRASITIRVPADRLDEALDRIEKGASEVQNRSVSGEDVTQQYTDLQSRLRNLEAAEAQLREIMASANKTEDVLAVYNQLVQVRGEIETVKGQIQYFEQSSRLSSVTVDLIPDVAAQPLQIGGWRPEGTAKEALTTLIRSLQFLADAGIWLGIYCLPIGLLFGVPGYFIIRGILRRRRMAKASGTTE
ncbi:MAG TPA: DUF4349 domain-containing protein [Anaerolineales bacterium]|nr:DUF4349 domain-containing protein [Anaerolineales bacterium]